MASVQRAWDFRLRYGVEEKNGKNHIGWELIKEIFPNLRQSDGMSDEERERLTQECYAHRRAERARIRAEQAEANRCQ